MDALVLPCNLPASVSGDFFFVLNIVSSHALSWITVKTEYTILAGVECKANCTIEQKSSAFFAQWNKKRFKQAKFWTVEQKIAAFFAQRSIVRVRVYIS